MGYESEYIVRAIKSTREDAGLSQRELGLKSGFPQGHVSKIEKGAVDLRVSSLVELSRALGLELVLVPRKALPVVRSIVRSYASDIDSGELNTDQGSTVRPAYRLDDD